MGHELVKPSDSEIASSLNLINECKEFSKIIYQDKFDYTRNIKDISENIDEMFQNFYKTCNDVKNIIKYDYVNKFKTLKNYVSDVDGLNNQLTELYDSYKFGKEFKTTPDELLSRYNSIKGYYLENLKFNANLNDNSNYIAFKAIDDKLKDIYELIKKNMDLSELIKPEYEDIENPIDYLLNEDTQAIRYKVNTSEGNKSLWSKLNRTVSGKEFVFNIFCSIDRRDFIDNIMSYNDSAAPIGWNTTISAPHMHFITLQNISKYTDKFKPNVKAIDIGTGSGFMALALSKLLGPRSQVIALDHIEEITQFAKDNISKHHSSYLNRIQFITADGKNGYAEGGPYDVIHIGAAVESISTALLAQIKNGGILWAPVGPKGHSKKIVLIVKDKDGEILRQELLDVNYAEMSTVDEQLNRSHHPYGLLAIGFGADDSDA